MPEKVNMVYGQVDENKQGIVEFRFDADTWEYRKIKNVIRVRRKSALSQGSVIKAKEV